MDVLMSAIVILVVALLGTVVWLLREGYVPARWVSALAALCGLGLIAMLITDWPTDSLNAFWAEHSVLAAVVSTLLLVGVPYLMWEASESLQQERLAAGLSGAGLGGIVDHIVDTEVALALLSRATAPENQDWDAAGRPLTWMREFRPNLRRLDNGQPRESDPRSHRVRIPDSNHSWRIELVDQALRRILGAMRDWSSLIGRSNDGTTALLMLSEIRKDLMELSHELELGHTSNAEALILSLRQRLRILAYLFEDLSRNSTDASAEHANTPFRHEILMRMWPLPSVGDDFSWNADQETVPPFSRVWRDRLTSVVDTLSKDTTSSQQKRPR